MPLCKYCGAAIEWIPTAGGYAPVDMEPVLIIADDRGRRYVTDEGTAVWGRPATQEDDPEEVFAAYAPHGRTCYVRRQYHEPDGT